MKIRVYLRSENILPIIVRMNTTQIDMAKRIGVSPHVFNLMLNQRKTVGKNSRDHIMNYFRRKRMKWDDVFIIQR